MVEKSKVEQSFREFVEGNGSPLCAISFLLIANL